MVSDSLLATVFVRVCPEIFSSKHTMPQTTNSSMSTFTLPAFGSVGCLYLTKLELSGRVSSAGSHGSSQLHFSVFCLCSKQRLRLQAARATGFLASMFKCRLKEVVPASFLLRLCSKQRLHLQAACAAGFLTACSSTGSHGSSQLHFSMSCVCVPSSGCVFEQLTLLVSQRACSSEGSHGSSQLPFSVLRFCSKQQVALQAACAAGFLAGMVKYRLAWLSGSVVETQQLTLAAWRLSSQITRAWRLGSQTQQQSLQLLLQWLGCSAVKCSNFLFQGHDSFGGQSTCVLSSTWKCRVPQDFCKFRAMASPSHEPFLRLSLWLSWRVPSAWNGGSWLGCRDLPAMGAVFYLGAGCQQWKPLDTPGTHLPFKQGSN